MPKKSCGLILALFISAWMVPASATEVATIAIRATKVMPDGSVRMIVSFRSDTNAPLAMVDPKRLLIERDDSKLSVDIQATPFGASGEGLGLLLAIDTSGSMSAALPRIRESLSRFVGQLRSGADRTAVDSIGDARERLLDFTGDKELISRTLARLSAGSKTTALFESIFLGIDDLRRRGSDIPPRRLVLVVSDGLNEKEGRGPQECIDLARQSKIQVHSLLFVASPSKQVLQQKGWLEKISTDTHALTTTVSDPDAIDAVVGRLREDIMSEFVIAWREDPAVGDGKEHQLTLRYGNVSATSGYRAPLFDVPQAKPTSPTDPLPGEPTAKPNAPLWRTWWVVAAAGIGLLLILGVVLLRVRQRSRLRIAAIEESHRRQLAEREAALELARDAAKKAPEPAPILSTPSVPQPAPKAPRKTEYRPPDVPGLERVSRLRVTRGLGTPTILELPAGGATIGYDLSNGIVLNADSVSGTHAAIVTLEQPSGFGIRDLGSTNGTFVDEVQVGDAVVPLRRGSQIRLGAVLLVCE